MDKLYAIMKESLRNGELDIDSVAEKLGVSRSKFYYKVKALTGQTPNEFFTTYKLNYGAELLKKGKYKISAIADMLGFSSPSHFAAQFKKQFGVLPSQYISD
jgi:AraC-like DNA-binding protein